MSRDRSAEKDATTYYTTRFACHCGRFLAVSAIRSTDHRDDSRYYGIRTEVEWDCSRCGTVKGEEWEPPIVLLGTRPIPPASPETASEPGPAMVGETGSEAPDADPGAASSSPVRQAAGVPQTPAAAQVEQSA